jgi:hypothetical protein
MSADDDLVLNGSLADLFVYYNDLYFGGKLGACTVEWSSGRMTL